ncbi:MAG TPA: hypothetical protein VME68_08995 [Acidobacteriaceae bacterium]|nr:hypothetical protein [Acidobacteriaceae bacterium]
MHLLRRSSCIFAFFALAAPLFAQSVPAAVPVQPIAEGAHDFDFEVGTWKIHLRRLADRLAGSSTWIEFDGTSTTRKILGGRGNLEQFETDSPSGHIEGLTLRLYDPQTHQWRIYWANQNDGQVGTPMIGSFHDGVGEFYDQEFWKGRSVYVRFLWSQITPNSAHFEQSYSVDGGKTWEVNWITDQTRTGDEPSWDQPQDNRPSTAIAADASSAMTPFPDGQHDFDFNFGVWKTHIERRIHPLDHSDEWTELNGTVTVHKLWGGRAAMEEIDATGASGHLQGITLFTYDPVTRQWNQDFAGADSGELEPPAIGVFRDGCGMLVNQDTFNGRTILVSAAWSQIAPDSHHFEQAFSDDGGKTWEPNFVASLTRISP